MLVSGQRWLEGAFYDPVDRCTCFIFDALAAILPEAVGATVGADIGAAAIPAVAGDVASLTLPEVAVTAAAPEALSIGTGVGAAGAGALGAGALGTSGLDFGSSLSDALGTGFSGGSTAPGANISAGAGGDTTGGLTTGTKAAGNVLPQAAPTTGPIAAAPPAPASVPTMGDVTGTFGGQNLVNPSDLTGDTTGSSTTGTGTSGLRSSIDKGLNNLTGGFLDSKDLGSVLSVGGLGMNILNRNQPIPGQKQLKNAASSLSATSAAQANLGQQLEGYLQSGTLPAGLAAGVRSATEAAKATIRNQYATRGMSGSSAEAQDLQAAEDRALSASQEVALSLLQQGSSIVGQSANTESLAATIYNQILGTALQQDASLGSAIGNFASSLAGGGSGQTVTLKAA